MKAPYTWKFGNQRENLAAKQQATSDLLSRGIAGSPPAPRDVLCQSGARKVLLTWNLAQNDLVTDGWRVYRDTESNLVAQINDRGTRQIFLDVTAGSSPPVYNFFVCGFSRLGAEGPKVQVQGSAKTESGAPSDPTVPPEYTAGSSGGGNTGYNPYSGSGLGNHSSK